MFQCMMARAPPSKVMHNLRTPIISLEVVVYNSNLTICNMLFQRKANAMGFFEAF